MSDMTDDQVDAEVRQVLFNDYRVFDGPCNINDPAFKPKPVQRVIYRAAHKAGYERGFESGVDKAEDIMCSKEIASHKAGRLSAFEEANNALCDRPQSTIGQYLETQIAACKLKKEAGDAGN